MFNSLKFVLRLGGVVALLALFAIVYGLVSPRAEVDSNIFDANDKSIGQLGGFHFLTKLDYQEGEKFWRIAFNTTLNRATPLAEDLETPYIEVNERKTTGLNLFSAGDEPLSTLGSHYLSVNLSDTQIIDTTSDPETYVFEGEERQFINQANINEVRLVQPFNDSSYQVLIGVDGPVDFRIMENPQDASIVWLDILK
jgi:hypothetical protein